ncbi:MAG: hypothetical protein CMF50_04990 [Legionellales bacterium]|nr:hypothetical protein [Legionellales bacterium]
MKLFNSLTTKISFFTGLVIIAGMITISSVVYFFAKQTLLEHSMNSVKSSAELVASDVESALVKIVSDLAVLSKTPPIQGIIRSSLNQGEDKVDNSTIDMWNDRLSTIFTAMLKVNPAYTQIRYIGIAERGKEIVRVNRSRNDIFRTHTSALQAKASEKYYKEATNLAQGSVAFSNITFNREHGRYERPLVPTLRVMMPIYSAKQQLFGVLIINVDFQKYLREALLRVGKGYQLYFYNDFGDLFVFMPEESVLKFYPSASIDEQAEGILRGYASTADYIQSILTDNTSITVQKSIYSSYENKDKVLTMVLQVNKSRLFKDDNIIINYILVALVLISLLTIGLVFIFSNRLLKKLRDMAANIELSSGGLRTKLKLPTGLNDEVGVLARALDKKTKQLESMALYDSLTGLANRKNFVERLEEAIPRAKRNGTSAGLMYLDLNNFKEVNDKYGHDYGDELLIKFSRNLKKTVRKSELCARLGGDEFVVILQDIKDNTVIETITARFREALNKTYSIKGFSIYMSASIGIALYPDDGDTVDKLLKQADENMYSDKAQQNNLDG